MNNENIDNGNPMFTLIFRYLWIMFKMFLVTAMILTPGLRHKGRARWAVRYAYDHLIRRHLS